MNEQTGYVEIIIQRPNFAKPIRARHNYNDTCLSMAFEKRPKDWDLPFGNDSRKQTLERQRLSQALASRLAHYIMELLASDDPIKGYEPEEWHKMHESPFDQPS